MSDLTSYFDILQGWPNGSGLSWDFKEYSSAARDIVEGDIVSIVDDSGPAADLHDSALAVGGQADQPWLVVRGKNQEDSSEYNTLTCVMLRTGIIFKVETSLTPTPGASLWSSSGVLTATDPAGGELPVGKVLEFNPDEGWMIVES
jgi:hypothetical protein